LDEYSASNTYPTVYVDQSHADVTHEASIKKIDEEKLFYLTSRGLTENEAMKLIVSGFLEPVVNALPLEYAVEFESLLEMELEK
jgi:Fe-S cluster assembly protein SufB